MDNWKKIVIFIIIVSIVLVLAYFVLCNMWFIASVKNVLSRVDGVAYERMTIQGINKVAIKGITITVPVPIDIKFDQITISSDKRMFTKDIEYEVMIKVSGGTVVLGNDNEDVEGYTGTHYAIDPFDTVITIRDKGVKVEENRCYIENAGEITYAFDLYKNYVTAVIAVVLNANLVNNAPDPEFFKQAFVSADERPAITVTIDGELPLLRVQVRSPRIEMDFAYSTEKNK